MAGGRKLIRRRGETTEEAIDLDSFYCVQPSSGHTHLVKNLSQVFTEICPPRPATLALSSVQNLPSHYYTCIVL